MSASSSNSPSDSITCGCLHFPIFTRARRIAKKPKKPSTASRPQSAEHFPEDVRDVQNREAGDGSDPGIPIISTLPSQLPPVVSEAPSMDRGNGDAQSRAARGGVDPGFPIPTEIQTVAIETVEHTEDVRDTQNREAGDGSDPGISIISALPSQVPPVVSKAPSMDRGNGDAQSREAGGGVDPCFPIPIETQTVATETRSITLFQELSNLQISNTKFTTIGGDATIFQFGDGQFTEAHRNLICDHIATLAALPDIKDNLKKHALTHLIILLPRAEAVFDDYQTKKKSGPCFDGTRVALLREMASWVTSQDESRMYILSGLAGIGKSTVAYTIASRAANP
ncbi:hypothetical protein M378DRAFT_903934, partial [Amanita muscaria Koide BX008]